MKLLKFCRLFWFFIPISLFLGCASPPKVESLKSVKLDMTKADVLEIVGNPDRTGRHNGHDRWTYLAPDRKDETARYVYFDKGRVVYVGEIQKNPKLEKASKPKPRPLKPKDRGQPGNFKPIGN